MGLGAGNFFGLVGCEIMAGDTRIMRLVLGSGGTVVW